MIFRFGISRDGENVINKDVRDTIDLDLQVRKGFNIEEPVIDLILDNDSVFLKTNYCECLDLNLKYFIKRIENLGYTRYRFFMECDYLETYKDSILNSNCRYNRLVEDGDNVEGSFLKGQLSNIEIFESDVELEKEDTILFSVIGIDDSKIENIEG